MTWHASGAIVKDLLVPHDTETAPEGEIVPPAPADAVMVSISSFWMVPVETLGEPTVALVAEVSVTWNVSSGSQWVSPFASTVIVPLVPREGMTIDELAG